MRHSFHLPAAMVRLLFILCSLALLSAPAQAEVLVWFGTWKQVNTRSDGTTTVPGKVTILMDSDTLETEFVVATKKGGKKVGLYFSGDVGVTTSNKGAVPVKTLTSIYGVSFQDFYHIGNYFRLTGGVAALPLTRDGASVNLPKKISGRVHRSQGYYREEEEFTENIKATLNVSFKKADTWKLNDAGQTLNEARDSILQYYSEKGYELPAS